MVPAVLSAHSVILMAASILSESEWAMASQGVVALRWSSASIKHDEIGCGGAGDT